MGPNCAFHTTPYKNHTLFLSTKKSELFLQRVIKNEKFKKQ